MPSEGGLRRELAWLHAHLSLERSRGLGDEARAVSHSAEFRRMLIRPKRFAMGVMTSP